MEDFDISNPAPYFLAPNATVYQEEILQRADGFFKIPMVVSKKVYHWFRQQSSFKI
jgi:hypothetical protein